MIIAFSGDRNFSNKWFVYEIIFVFLDDKDLKILVGDCRGLDYWVRYWAEELDVPHEVFKANWDKHGKAAGPIRNKRILERKPDVLIAIHPNMDESKGTKNMVAQARGLGIPVIELAGEE
jgi:hypothetical protein